ncbi:MAG: hypothetical protein GY856_00150 [bacterium]|nr:hypothetical protein [bacterium]
MKILGKIFDIELIATGSSIRDLGWIEETYGGGHWRKLRGNARVELSDGTVCWAEVHWYEAHGIGRVEHKIKRLLE